LVISWISARVTSEKEACVTVLAEASNVYPVNLFFIVL